MSPSPVLVSVMRSIFETSNNDVSMSPEPPDTPRVSSVPADSKFLEAKEHVESIEKRVEQAKRAQTVTKLVQSGKRRHLPPLPLFGDVRAHRKTGGICDVQRLSIEISNIETVTNMLTQFENVKPSVPPVSPMETPVPSAKVSKIRGQFLLAAVKKETSEPKVEKQRGGMSKKIDFVRAREQFLEHAHAPPSTSATRFSETQRTAIDIRSKKSNFEATTVSPVAREQCRTPQLP